MDLCAFCAAISLIWLSGSSGQLLPVVSPDKITDGGTFNATCNYQRMTIAPEAEFITALTLERKIPNDANYTSIAIYNPFLPRKQNVTNIPFRRNWTVTFTGGRNDVDSNVETIRIDLLIHDANCSDAGLYRCSAVTNLNTIHESPAQNVTAYAHLSQQPIVMIPDNKNLPYYSENEAGSNVTLTCIVYGSNDLILTWKYRPKGSSREFTYSDSMGITESGPTIEYSKGPCVTWRLESSLSFALDVNDANTTYFCVVNRNLNEITREKFTIGVQAVIENTTPPNSNGGPDSGAIAGGVIAAIVIIVVVIVLVYFCWYRKRNQKEKETDKSEEKTKKGNTKVRFHIPSMFSTESSKADDKHGHEEKRKDPHIVKSENLYNSSATRSQDRGRSSDADQNKANSLDSDIYNSKPIQETWTQRNKGYVNEMYDNDDDRYFKSERDEKLQDENTENVYDNADDDDDDVVVEKRHVYRREDREHRRQSRNIRSGRDVSISMDNTSFDKSSDV